MIYYLAKTKFTKVDMDRVSLLNVIDGYKIDTATSTSRSKSTSTSTAGNAVTHGFSITDVEAGLP